LGSTLIIFAALLPRLPARLAKFLVLVGLVGFVAPSSTPLPWAIYVVLLTTIGWWWFGRKHSGPRIAVALLWLFALAYELYWQSMPTIFKDFHDPVRIAVIGDSLTAGLAETRATNWPKTLSLRPGFAVVHDFAAAGATCQSGLEQAAKVPGDAQIVVVEIGGNDLLGSTKLSKFEGDYDSLLAAISRPDRVLIGFELPLPPFHNSWGLAQRRIASRHGVKLIPKWRLMRILVDPTATVDTIHPTQAGQDALEKLVWEALWHAIPATQTKSDE
jgi:acyl-CoA thioesterase I